MTSILNRLRHRSDVHTVEPIDEGFLVRPVAGRETDFAVLVREALDSPIDDFVILPTRRSGVYEFAQIIPLV